MKLFIVCLLGLFTVYCHAADTLDIDYIDKLYVREPQRAYRLLEPVRKRLEREGWKHKSRMRYERVAGFVCLSNNLYADALRHALAMQQLGSKDRGNILDGLDIQCQLADKLGQYEQLARLVDQIRQETKKITDREPRERAIKAYYSLLCEYYKTRALSKSGQTDKAMQSWHEARAMLNLFADDPNENVRGNCAIMRHSFDLLLADIYIDGGEPNKAAVYIPDAVQELNREQQNGGDGATDHAGYDIHRMYFNLTLGHALVKCGRKDEALKAAAEADSLFHKYPPMANALGSLLGIYVEANSIPQNILSLSEDFYRNNLATPSVELLSICNSLLQIYIRQGEKVKAEAMTGEVKRINDFIHREDMEFYDVLSENSSLRVSYYKQRGYKMVATGVATALVIIIVTMIYFHRRRLRDNQYLYKYVRLAVQQTPAKRADNPKTEENLQEQIETILSENNNFLSQDFNTGYLESRLQMKRYAIDQQLAENYHTSLNDIVTNLRLQHACKLLEQTDYVLEYIATQSGFGTLRTFYRQFKKKYNLTPTEYRRLGQKKNQ
ncbi:helix-turn-helix transcriptional regulator [Bacteroides heparinolyticus]|uniref:helix-turn-helix transcriptional regulator n=1 Tax=Prevotella heparinolytica TaxID=28113 RepID=UPI0035A184AA